MAVESNPPSMDGIATRRWLNMPLAESPWLHEEVARRMAERLPLITLQPQQWLHWQPSKGGLQAHAVLQQAYPQAQAWAYEPFAHGTVADWQAHIQPAEKTGWLKRALGREPAKATTQFGEPAQGSIDMLWANMVLHTYANPMTLMQTWRKLLAPKGFVMFSALGPDSFQELRQAYQSLGWQAPPAHQFTDMHDWGDMLMEAGFAEPVLDMERMTLTFSSADKLLQELRGLGRNLALERDTRTHGKAWYQQLCQALQAQSHNGSIPLTIEVVYGHALQAPPRHTVAASTHISLQDMQTMLRKDKP